MSSNKARYSAIIEQAIAKAKAIRDLGTVEAQNGAEAYAYPRGIAWGVNILRGVRRPDGVDEAVS